MWFTVQWGILYIYLGNSWYSAPTTLWRCFHLDSKSDPIWRNLSFGARHNSATAQPNATESLATSCCHWTCVSSWLEREKKKKNGGTIGINKTGSRFFWNPFFSSSREQWIVLAEVSTVFHKHIIDQNLPAFNWNVCIEINTWFNGMSTNWFLWRFCEIMPHVL